MLSDEQLSANRANAENSTGPRTEERKNRSRLIAIRHNLTGQVAALTEPDRLAFNTFSQDLIRDLDPRGTMELYEQRLNRTVQKNIALLKSLQSERKARRAAEMEEAKRLLHLSEMKNIPYQPAKDGFIFSVNEIHREIDLQRRLDQNRCPDFRHFKPRQFAAQAA